MSAKKDFRNITKSQFDRGQIDKAEFSELQSAKKVYNTTPILKDSFTHFIQEVDSDGYPTKVNYYQAAHPTIDRVTFVSDNSGDLAGTYFILQEFITKKTYAIYYVVDGVGTAPSVADEEIAVNIQENDGAPIIALSTKQVLSGIESFIVSHKSFLSNSLEIEYQQFGDTEAIDVDGTGFTVTRLQEGFSAEVGEVELEYDGNKNPIYNGSTLKGLLYNPYTASFDVERDSIDVSVVLDRPKSFDVDNIAVAFANTEYQIVLPDKTRKFKIKAREADTILQITNVSSGDYFTIPYGCCYEEDGLSTDSVTVYIKSNKNNRTLELLTWS